MNYRDYSPTLGRWVSVDPITFAGGDNVLYRFVGDNPIRRTDPRGLAQVTELDNGNWVIRKGGTLVEYTPPPPVENGFDWGSLKQAALDVTIFGQTQAVYSFGQAYLENAKLVNQVNNLPMNQGGPPVAAPPKPITDLLKAVGQGELDAIAMAANAATFHQIASLNNYVKTTIQQNGGAYNIANLSMHIGVYAAYLAGGA